MLIALALASSGSVYAESEATPCRVPGIRQQVLCASVQRPLDPGQPQGIQISVGYVVVPALARRKLPDPVVFLAGGPGQSAISVAPSMVPLLARLNNRRDLIFIDQRGTGRSAPLQCEALSGQGFAEQFDTAAQSEQLTNCRRELAKLPYVGSADGLRFFTTSIAMQDVDAVRRQLGVEKLNLIGASYGTRAALEVLRQFPETVRRAVLDGVAPPDMALPASMSADAQQALDSLFDACEREAACSKAYPRLRASWAAMLSSLPKQIELRDPRSGQTEKINLDKQALLGVVRGPLYLPSMASALPAAISEAAAGRFEALAALSTVLTPRPGRESKDGIAAGMHFSVVCSEDVPRIKLNSDHAGRDFGDASRDLYQRVCADWPRGGVAADFYTVPPSNSAVLLLSGGLDPATPPRHGARVAARLGAKASHRVVANAGHGVLAIGCVRDVVFLFVDAEDDADALAVESSCTDEIPRPPAFLPPSPKSPR